MGLIDERAALGSALMKTRSRRLLAGALAGGETLVLLQPPNFCSSPVLAIGQPSGLADGSSLYALGIHQLL